MRFFLILTSLIIISASKAQYVDSEENRKKIIVSQGQILGPSKNFAQVDNQRGVGTCYAHSLNQVLIEDKIAPLNTIWMGTLNALWTKNYNQWNLFGKSYEGGVSCQTLQVVKYILNESSQNGFPSPLCTEANLKKIFPNEDQWHQFFVNNEIECIHDKATSDSYADCMFKKLPKNSQNSISKKAFDQNFDQFVELFATIILKNKIDYGSTLSSLAFINVKPMPQDNLKLPFLIENLKVKKETVRTDLERAAFLSGLCSSPNQISANNLNTLIVSKILKLDCKIIDLQKESKPIEKLVALQENSQLPLIAGYAVQNSQGQILGFHASSVYNVFTSKMSGVSDFYLSVLNPWTQKNNLLETVNFRNVMEIDVFEHKN